MIWRRHADNFAPGCLYASSNALRRTIRAARRSSRGVTVSSTGHTIRRSLHMLLALALAAAVGGLSVYGLLYMHSAPASRVWTPMITLVAASRAPLFPSAASIGAAMSCSGPASSSMATVIVTNRHIVGDASDLAVAIADGTLQATQRGSARFIAPKDWRAPSCRSSARSRMRMHSRACRRMLPRRSEARSRARKSDCHCRRACAGSSVPRSGLQP